MRHTYLIKRSVLHYLLGPLCRIIGKETYCQLYRKQVRFLYLKVYRVNGVNLVAKWWSKELNLSQNIRSIFKIIAKYKWFSKKNRQTAITDHPNMLVASSYLKSDVISPTAPKAT